MVEGSNTVKELLIKNNLELRKSLGQHFLVDPNISRKIIRLSGITPESQILEIGPGVGALTAMLCQTAKSVVAIELDSRMLPVLRDVLEPYDNVTVIHGDVLKLDIKVIVNEYFAGISCSVCANLPYNITTPALEVLFEAGVFDNITVMIQREVARRITAKPGTTDYGAFTVYANYHSTPEILFDVPPECFNPRPKVFSSVINMNIREKKLLIPDEEKLLFRIVRAAFGQRRKTLVNALYTVFNDLFEKKDIEKIVVNCGFNPKVRGEMLSLDEFIVLTSNFLKHFVTFCR